MSLFKGTINGLDKIFVTDNDVRRTIVVSGGSGCLKSSFTYNLLSLHLKNNDEKALYISLEEGAESLYSNLKSLNIDINDNIKIIDYRQLRTRFKSDEKTLNYIYVTRSLINSYKKNVGNTFKYIIIDSLGALYSLLKIKDPRGDTYEFFTMLDELGMTTFVICEQNILQSHMSNEAYLADGVIELGHLETQRTVKRYIQVKKMRSSHHKMEKFSIEVKDDGIHVMGPMYGY